MPFPQKTTQPYNGWANYETWCVNLWLMNTAEDYTAAQAVLTEAESPTLAAEALRAYVENKNPLSGTASLYTDLLNAALEAVDWNEIVEAFHDN